MKYLLLVSILVCFGFSTHAQRYQTALGVKADYTTLDIPSAELSLKHFFSGPSAVEVNLGGSRRYIWLQTMYMRNQFLTSDLDWYWGAGADGGYWVKGSYGRTDIGTTQGFWAGIDGTIGLEYTFDVVPINLALDTGPSMRIYPEVKFGWMAGFAMRYAFR